MPHVDTSSVRDTRAEPWAHPLRVEAHMAAPIVYQGDGLHLDGPLQWAAFRQHEVEHGRLDPLRPGQRAPDYEMPVATWTAPAPDDAPPALRCGDGTSVWGWCCSAVEADWLVSGKREVRKRPPLDEIKRWSDADKHNYGIGPTKARNVTHPTEFAYVLTWWLLGDPGAVERLLVDHVTHIGRLSRHGAGQVLRWVVEVDPDASTRWERRHMPDGWGGRKGRRMLGIRAPYWHAESKCWASAP